MFGSNPWNVNSIRWNVCSSLWNGQHIAVRKNIIGLTTVSPIGYIYISILSKGRWLVGQSVQPFLDRRSAFAHVMACDAKFACDFAIRKGFLYVSLASIFEIGPFLPCGFGKTAATRSRNCCMASAQK